jgi:hypothetical protein
VQLTERDGLENQQVEGARKKESRFRAECIISLRRLFSLQQAQAGLDLRGASWRAAGDTHPTPL